MPTLKPYSAKRHFTITAEPKPRNATTPPPNHHHFVIQLHNASRLHYDLRLELDGVLKSWAVPKGPSLNPKERCLAVEVEDHPIEYAAFEGSIPKGQYGGGSVIIWDRGTWSPLNTNNPAAALRKGHLDFHLAGSKLRGSWMLVRMDSSHTTPRHWLLIKKLDPAATTNAALDPRTTQPQSVVSGKLVTDPSLAPEPAPSRPAARRRQAPAVRNAARAPMPDVLRPQLASTARDPPDGPDWLHEAKFDGYRILAHIVGGSPRLLTRNGHDWTAKFPELANALKTLPITDAIIDGELVALSSAGLADFHALQAALKDRCTADLVYYVFDLPYLEGADLSAAELITRREQLQRLLAGTASTRIRFSSAIPGQGAHVVRSACELGLEGIISKHARSPYTPGRSTTWLKIKCARGQELVVIGYTPMTGHDADLGALLLGYFDAHGELTYAGRVGTGFDAATRADLLARLKPLALPDRPAMRNTAPITDRHVTWVRPDVVVEVRFATWTRDGVIRHASFQGVREDKPAREVRRETPRDIAPTKTIVRRTPAKTAQRRTDAEVRGITITHPDRVVYPELGITKLQLAQYYDAAAPRMLELIADRPVSLVRCPSGIAGTQFFQRHLKGKAVPGVRTIAADDGKTTPIIESPEGLLALVQLNVVEFHQWGAQGRNLERPDQLVFDLDPGEGVTWPTIVRAARLLKRLLDVLDLRAFAKTSGGKGLHITVPLQPKADWPTAKRFALAVTNAMAAQDPARFVTQPGASKRVGKIFVDYLRNQRSATSVAAYSARARPAAGISMPLTWSELDDSPPTEFSVRTPIARLRPAIWRGFDGAGTPLTMKMVTSVQGPSQE